MYFICHLFIKLSLISVVFGIINNEYNIGANENETSLQIKLNKVLHDLEMKIYDKVLPYVDQQMMSLKNKIDETWTENLRVAMDASLKNITERLDASMTSLEERITQKLNGTIKMAVHNDTIPELPCKEVFLNSSIASPSQSMQSLAHSALRRDSAGRLAHFETRVGVYADGYVGIRLMNKESALASDILYSLDIGWSSNQVTDLDKFNYTSLITRRRVPTPDILSATEFRFFYVRIDNGTLQFGKEGSTPLISHDDDARLKSLKYIQYYYIGRTEATIRHDCPAA